VYVSTGAPGRGQYSVSIRVNRRQKTSVFGSVLLVSVLSPRIRVVAKRTKWLHGFFLSLSCVHSCYVLQVIQVGDMRLCYSSQGNVIDSSSKLFVTNADSNGDMLLGQNELRDVLD
jgi:hypothetical protein